MKPTSFETIIRLQFDTLVKRVIDCTVKDYEKELHRRERREVLIQEMIPYSIADFSVICSSVNYSQFTYSSHRFFLIHKYHDIPLRYITLCWMNRRNHPCLFYFPT